MRLFPLAAAVLFAVPLSLAAQTPPYYGRWSDIPALPQVQLDGCALLAVDADHLVYLPGGGARGAWRYTISAETWTALPDLPIGVGRGSSVVLRPGTTVMYVLPGNFTTAFFEYDGATGASRSLAAPTASLYVWDGHRLAASATGIYLFLNQEQQIGELGGFLEYTPDPAGPGTWARLAGPALGTSLPANGLYSLANGGDGFLYGVRSQTQQLLRFTLPAGPWISSDDAVGILPALPELASESGAFSQAPVGGALLVVLGDRFGSRLHRFDPAGGTFALVAELCDLAGRDTQLAVPAGDVLHIATGYGYALRRYDVGSTRYVSTLAPAPETGVYGSDLVSVGDGVLYAISGSAGKLLRYDVAADRWDDRGPTPILSISDSDLLYDGSDYLYVTNPQSGIVRLHRFALTEDNPHDQPVDTWLPMTPLNKNSSNGGQAVVVGGRIHYFPGGSREVWEFTPPAPGADPGDGGAWALGSTATFTLKNRGLGCATVHPGTGTQVYLSWINSTMIFARYDTATHTWEQLKDTPVAFTWGSTLAYPGRGGYLYATSGGSPLAWAFELPTPSLPLGHWHAIPSMPGEAMKGAGLVHPGRGNHLYFLQGRSIFLWRYRFSPPPVLEAVAQAFPGGAVLPPGGLLPGRAFEVVATVTDDDPEPLVLEVRAKPAGEAFLPSDPAIATSAASTPGSPVTCAVVGLAPGRGYHWELRSLNSEGESSGWVPFGGPIDFETAANRLPSLDAVGQFAAESGLAIPPGGQVYETVRFSGIAQDEDGDEVQIQVELRAEGEAFTGQPTLSGEFRSAGMVVDVATLPISGGQRWAWRAVDAWEGTSAWLPGSDFRFDATGSAGNACLGSATGNACVIAAVILLMLTRRVR